MSTVLNAKSAPPKANTEIGELEVQIIAQTCKAASDPFLLQILRVLKSESFGVLELCSIFDLAQPKLSHHLKVLATAGLVATRREGNSIFYRRPLLKADKALTPLINSLFAAVDQIWLDDKIFDRITQIKSERTQSSLGFFSKNIYKFRKNQDLIAENSQYASNLLELIEAAGLPERATAIEIGPGEGHFLPALAQRFAKVFAIDNSRQMLELAKLNIDQQQLDNVSLVLGDPNAGLKSLPSGDLLACNMVLHHLPSPSDFVKQMAKLVSVQGYMLLSELTPHDQDWARESCGDLWLGFEPEDIQHWAKAAGLESRQSLYLGLRNGFQIQLHLFQKQG